MSARWNGQSGDRRHRVDRVRLTSEAVIPGAGEAQRHAHLINSLIKGDVRYAAGGGTDDPSPPPRLADFGRPARAAETLSGGWLTADPGASPQDLATLPDFMRGIFAPRRPEPPITQNRSTALTTRWKTT